MAERVFLVVDYVGAELVTEPSGVDYGCEFVGIACEHCDFHSFDIVEIIERCCGLSILDVISFFSKIVFSKLISHHQLGEIVNVDQ